MVDYQDWHIPFLRDNISLRQARDSLATVKAGQDEIPLMVQLVENPKYRFPGFSIFHGAVDLEQHDYIHIVLGRGLLNMDEAFTIGFTMGSTNKVTTLEEDLFALISRFFYPNVYKFNDDEISVFKDAVRLGYISDCAALDQFYFPPHLDLPLADLRIELGLEPELLLAYYRLEQQRYPSSIASQRLLDT